jgi:hypothetical protein
MCETTLDNWQRQFVSVRGHLSSDCGQNGTELQTTLPFVRNGGHQEWF